MNRVKSIQNVTLASLLLFLGAFTLTADPLQQARALEDIEAYSLVSALTAAQWPNGASIPVLTAKFDFAPMMAPRQGLIVDIIRDHYHDDDILEGQLRLPFGESAAFQFHPEKPSSSFAARRQSYRSYEKGYAGSNDIHFAEYSIASLAFPRKWHDVLLADGRLSWSGVKWQVIHEWAVVGDEPPLFIEMGEIREKACKNATPWAGFEEDYNKCFYDVLQSFRGQQLTLPVVGAKIPWAYAGAAFALAALYLAVLFLHGLLRFRDHVVERDEPWLLVEPCQPRGRMERVLFKSISMTGGIVLVLVMALPSATVLLVRATLPTWALIPSVGATALLALLGLRELFGLARRGDFSHVSTERAIPPGAGAHLFDAHGATPDSSLRQTSPGLRPDSVAEPIPVVSNQVQAEAGPLSQRSRDMAPYTTRERVVGVVALSMAVLGQVCAVVVAVRAAPVFARLFAELDGPLPLITQAFFATRPFLWLAPLVFAALSCDVLRRQNPSLRYFVVVFVSSAITPFLMFTWIVEAMYAPIYEALQKLG